MIHLKRMSAEDAVQHKHSLCVLLSNTYSINFPETTCDHCYTEEKIQGLIQYLQEDQAVVFGAFGDTSLIGFVWGFERTILCETRMHINEIVVSDAYRGQGIGQQLLGAISDEAKQRGIGCIDLFCSIPNVSAIRFYQKHGFEMERYQLRLKLT